MLRATDKVVIESIIATINITIIIDYTRDMSRSTRILDYEETTVKIFNFSS